MARRGGPRIGGPAKRREEEEGDAATENRGVGQPPRMERNETERNGTGRNGTDGTGRDETRRNGSGGGGGGGSERNGLREGEGEPRTPEGLLRTRNYHGSIQLASRHVKYYCLPRFVRSTFERGGGGGERKALHTDLLTYFTTESFPPSPLISSHRSSPTNPTRHPLPSFLSFLSSSTSSSSSSFLLSVEKFHPPLGDRFPNGSRPRSCPVIVPSLVQIPSRELGRNDIILGHEDPFRAFTLIETIDSHVETIPTGNGKRLLLTNRDNYPLE